MNARTVTALISFTALLVGLLLFAIFAFHPSGPDLSSPEGPWTGYVSFSSADYFKYVLGSFFGSYSDFPWVVRVSYAVILASCLAVLILAYVISWDVAERRRNTSFLNRIRVTYLPGLRNVAFADRSFSDAEISALFIPAAGDVDKYWKRILWIDLFIELRVSVPAERIDFGNIAALLRTGGFDDFMENRLIYGNDREKMKVIQAIRLLNMNLPDSITARLVNSRNEGLTDYYVD